jgi:hypothetical protein
MHNFYSRDHVPNECDKSWTSKSSPNSKTKITRGFADVYDCALETFYDLNNQKPPEKLLEIGIGNFTSHGVWGSVFPDAEIYGIDSCDFEFNSENKSDLAQVINNTIGLGRYYSLTMDAQNRFHLYYKRNAYDSSCANEFYEANGHMDFIVNDGKQNGIVHYDLKENWQDKIVPHGFIIQDKIARAPGQHAVIASAIKKAIDSENHGGWLIYDCTDKSQCDDDPIENGYIGVYVNAEYREQYASLLDKHARRVYSIDDIPLEWQYHGPIPE